MGSGIHYSKEFKIEAVRSVIESSRTYSDVANELSIHKDTLRKWVREVKKDRLEDDTMGRQEISWALEGVGLWCSSSRRAIRVV